MRKVKNWLSIIAKFLKNTKIASTYFAGNFLISPYETITI
ncbi:integral membrane protein [Capnocytophaga sp. oral taxon 338 str. F0234]|nr:integral membrane protein [Capnocytophaga sp. oral taxon 338 str. F0234]